MRGGGHIVFVSSPLPRAEGVVVNDVAGGALSKQKKRLRERNECLLLAGEDTVETQGMRERQKNK